MSATISGVVAYQNHRRVEELSLENQNLTAQVQALETPVRSAELTLDPQIQSQHLRIPLPLLLIAGEQRYNQD